MQIYGLEFLAACHHTDKFGKWIYVFNLSRDRMIKGLCYFIGEVSYGCNVPPCHVGGYWLCASGDIKYLMPCDFIKPQDRRVM